MAKIIRIIGSHGTGKTSLAKRLLMSDDGFDEIKTEYGYYCVSKNKLFVAIGKYSIKCGGCDCIKTLDKTLLFVDKLVKNYPNSNIIVEGCLLSSVFKKPLNNMLKLKYELNTDIIQVFLYADLKTLYYRVLNRNGNPPKLKHILSKYKSTYRMLKKYLELNEFKNYAINTENKTKEEVFEEFVKLCEIK